MGLLFGEGGRGAYTRVCVSACVEGGGGIIGSLRYTKSGGANHSSFNKKRGDFEQKIIISSNMKMKPLLANMLLKLPGEKYSGCISTPLFRNLKESKINR